MPITASWSHGPATWAILVHGGAGDVPDERIALHIAGCEKAAAAGAEVLANGGSAMDAASAAVIALEDDPLFNAGTGACLTSEGTIELDAAIMNGADLRAGAVAALPPFKNPIAIARRVMDKTRHVLLAAEGAALFAESEGFARASLESMITEHARKRLEQVRGTVGAVARDANGHVAAATSTGGMVNKLPGRVGDSPLIGAGTYADDTLGACSTTGHGEAMIRVCVAKTAVDRDVIHALETMEARTHETGGAIRAGSDGSLSLGRTTKTMSWAAATSDGDKHSGA
jgi:beta-aspartyl-peptidase (threonine type)